MSRIQANPSLLRAIVLGALLSTPFSTAQAAPPDAALMAKIKTATEGVLAKVAADPALVAAIKAQNGETAGMAEAAILAADKQWRAETSAAAKPTIAKVEANPASAVLKKAKADSKGLIDEAFAMDAKGLNVAMSDVTSDYWQGDEAKWSETFGKGPGARHVSEVDFDESSQSYVVQVSLTVVDPADGKPVGAITFGLNVEALNSL